MPYRLKQLHHGLLSFVLCLSALPCSVLASQRPNILFIFIDDMGPGALSCYGNQDISTPHMDSLSSTGVQFAQAYACSQCSPSRSAFLTGQYGPRSGMTKVINSRFWPRAPMLTPTASKALSPQVATIAKVLRDAGYTTGISGKWHVAGPYDTRGGKPEPFDFGAYGFDFVGTMSQESPTPHCVEGVTNDTIAFIKENRETPWFFFASHLTVHTPLDAPSDFVDKHEQRGYGRSRTRWGNFGQRPTAEYLAMLEHLDNNVGRVLETIESQGVRGETLVVLMGDNGTLDRVASSAPLRGGKGMPYEGSIRVPLLMRFPGVIAPGQTNASIVHIVDLYPTFASVAGATVPDEHTIDGVSLTQAMRGKLLDRNTLFWHMPHYVPMYARTPCSVIRRGKWKLIHYFGDTFDTTGFTPVNRKPAGKLVLGSRTELYDLVDDPGETTDQSATESVKRDELLAELQAWLDESSAKLPVANPDVAQDPVDWLDEKPNGLR